MAPGGDPPSSDIYSFEIQVPGRQIVQAPQFNHRLTHNHNSLDPVWGPNGQIVFARQLGPARRSASTAPRTSST